MPVVGLDLSALQSMPFISLGPLELRIYSGISNPNWSEVELAFVTSRTEAGFSQRETAIKAGFKSEHVLEALGDDNPDDAVTVNGTTYYGKVSPGFDGASHGLTARQVSARAEYQKAMRESRRLARLAAQIAAHGPVEG